MSIMITVARGKNLVQIVKERYGLKDNTDIMNVVNLIKDTNKLADVNL